MSKLDYMQESWFALLQNRAAQSSRRAVAREIGYSVTAVSLVLNGKYSGRTDAIKAAVLRRWGGVACPYAGKVIPLLECETLANGAAPTHNPIKMQQWRACQTCLKRPTKAA